MGPNWITIEDAKKRRELYPPARLLYVHRQTEAMLVLIDFLIVGPLGEISFVPVWRVIDDGASAETCARQGFSPFQWAEACLVMKGIE